MNDDTYYHTQRGPWGLMCYAFAVAFVVAAISLPVPALQITFLVTGLFILLIGVSMAHLTIEDAPWGSNYGVADALWSLDIDVKPMGVPLSDRLKGPWKVLMF